MCNFLDITGHIFRNNLFMAKFLLYINITEFVCFQCVKIFHNTFSIVH